MQDYQETAMSKGSKQRPLAVDSDTFADNWERIFKKKQEEKEKPDESTDSRCREHDEQQGKSV